MNLGEIKIQALSLMYPDIGIRFDDTQGAGVERAIYELKSSSNFEGLLETCIGAINRAFAQIEAKGLSPIKCVDKAGSLCKRTIDGKVEIDVEGDFLTLERLLCHRDEKTYACHCTVLGNKLYTKQKGNVYTVVYYSKIPRITRMTRDSYEVEIADNVCEAIPYFVMSELLWREDKERAKEARINFFEAINALEKAKPLCHQCFQIEYSME